MKEVLRSLPSVVANHIAAYNAKDPQGLLATFWNDALLNDAQREFIGHEAIGAWANHEIFAPNVTMEVETAREHHGNVIVSAKLDGDFDKTNLPDPLILHYYFVIVDDLIAQLFIIHNK
ncbi:nuclear transport factor 2 family protein [Sphingobium fuliginis]|uniref:SnoaL-like domain-containing protein n=1 Tax=Sphingobium fuliginis (strain ATCC 27551) TaxID=336203 RepID=A0A292ZGE6_SPHSA|nr:nuclear transport factor 2 family protein [Sphingobium fuliginis]GAY22158.1 hypothetical protein SFOMI_2713 [Sphingobium fuliginis]